MRRRLSILIITLAAGVLAGSGILAEAAPATTTSTSAPATIPATTIPATTIPATIPATTTAPIADAPATRQAGERLEPAAESAGEPFAHPTISHDGSWAGTMGVIILFCFFLPAAIIGPIVRANTPEEVPPAHSHDEPPGTSGHHGHGGTKMDEPH